MRDEVHLVGGMALVAQAAVLLSGAGKAAQLTVLVHWVHNPVDPRVLQRLLVCFDSKVAHAAPA